MIRLARGDRRDYAPRSPIKLERKSREILDELMRLVRGYKSN